MLHDILAIVIANASPFKKAMLAAKLAHNDGDIFQCKQFLGYAVMEAETEEERTAIADFVKEKGL